MTITIYGWSTRATASRKVATQQAADLLLSSAAGLDSTLVASSTR
jgi:hypothetical protein